MKKHSLAALFLAVTAAAGLLALPVQAAVSTDFPENTPSEVTISENEIEAFAERLETVRRDDDLQFNVINTMGLPEEELSTDYTAKVLNCRRGVVTVTEEDAEIFEQFFADEGLTDASDAEKLAKGVEWIHNNLVYDGYHTGDYAYSCFVEKGGECNIYNGAACALACYLGYDVQIIRGYRGSTGALSAHWWGELCCEDGSVLVLETGNLVDGQWYYLGTDYGDTVLAGHNYVKCDRYVYSGEPHLYYGAAVCPIGAEITDDDVTVYAAVEKGETCTVTRVALLAGTSEENLSEIASDEVSEECNTANDGEGFMAYYSLLSDGNLTVEPGETLYYAFEVTTGEGDTLRSTVCSVTRDLPEEEPAEEPAEEKPTEEKKFSLTTGAIIGFAAGALAVLAVVIALVRRAAEQRQLYKIHKNVFRR